MALNNADRATLWEVLGLKRPATGQESERPFVTQTFKGVHGGEALWGQDGRKFEARAGGNIRDRDWPVGRADAEAGGGGSGNTSSGSDSDSDPYDSNSRRSSRGGVSDDDFDPSDVFEPSGRPGRQPAADPDIPANDPSTAQRDRRSRVGAWLRVRPLSVGPTALHH